MPDLRSLQHPLGDALAEHLPETNNDDSEGMLVDTLLIWYERNRDALCVDPTLKGAPGPATPPLSLQHVCETLPFPSRDRYTYTPCVTEGGPSGNGPLSARPGDYVCAMAGSKYLCIRATILLRCETLAHLLEGDSISPGQHAFRKS